MVKIIEKSDLSAVKASPYAVVDFSATWCGPCRMTAPLLEELSEELAGQVDFFNCDVDANPDAAEEFEISSIPALVIMKNGRKENMTVGFRPKPALKDFVLSAK